MIVFTFQSERLMTATLPLWSQETYATLLSGDTKTSCGLRRKVDRVRDFHGAEIDHAHLMYQRQSDDQPACRRAWAQIRNPDRAVGIHVLILLVAVSITAS